ncbi:MAG: chloride channel protein [Deltaproteobacteria bacterium]|nr:chloride channel protein [Deltaproteobacteria bacterium]
MPTRSISASVNMRDLLHRVRGAWRNATWRQAVRLVGHAGLVGLVAGLAAIAFHALSQGLFDLCMTEIAGYLPRAAGAPAPTSVDGSTLRPYFLFGLPALGGLLSGWLVVRFAPEAGGHGTDAVLAAYHQRGGVIAGRVPLIKALASILTLGSGGSGGREGPISQIGAGFGSVVERWLTLSARERRVLLAAGMGAGVGAIFRAPLAGALFASEIHYREAEFESEAIIPSAVASIVSYCVYSLAFGWEPLFHTGALAFRDPRELGAYTALALAVSAAAYVFIKVFYWTRDRFKALPLSPYLKPALGGLLTGAVGVALYLATGNGDLLSVMAFGYGALQGALNGEIGIMVLLLIAAGKMVTTSLTIGSGGSAGVFGPSMVIGGAVGGAVGLALHQLFPGVVVEPAAYVLVGMAGFFAGAANTPVSTLIMVSEMSGNYHLLLPALWVATLSYLLLRRVSLYEHQVATRADSPAHRGDFRLDVLADMTVRDVFDPARPFVTFGPGTPLGDILKRAGGTHQSYFPIVDAGDKLTGILSLNDVREYLYDESMWRLALAADIATSNVVRVRLSDDLGLAIRRFAEKNIDELPVVADHDEGVLLGLLRRKDVLDAYNRRVWQLNEERRAEAG